MARRIVTPGGVPVAHRPLPRKRWNPPPNVPAGPTPERLAQREALAEGGDPALTTTPLDVALLRGRISRGQHAAGRQYAFLWHASGHRTPRANAAELDREDRDPGTRMASLPDGAQERIAAEFRDAREAVLRLCGLGGVAVLENLVIYEQWPSWAWASNKAALMASQVSARSVAVGALTALTGHLAALQGYSRARGWQEPDADIMATAEQPEPEPMREPAIDLPAPPPPPQHPRAPAHTRKPDAVSEAEMLRLLDAELESRRTTGRHRTNGRLRG
jgi:hypothetical protein